MSSGRTRYNGHKLKYKKIPVEEKLFDLRMIKHRDMGGCGVSILGVTQNLTGHSPEQAVVADPALSRGIGLDGL